MRQGSFCTGILGLDRAVADHFGCELAWVSEVEPAPCLVIEREHPGVPNLGDLTALDFDTVEPVEVITAGYPCQPFSHAGRRKGTSDARHLWPFIADAVRRLRPRYVVLENVAGHLSLGFDTVLGDLAEAGFDAEWCVLRASDVGAPHQRARVFIVATDTRSAGAGRDPRAVPRAAEEGRRQGADVRPAGDVRSDAADLEGERCRQGRGCRAVPRVEVDGGPTVEPRRRGDALPPNAPLDGHAGAGDAWGRRGGLADRNTAAADAYGDGSQVVAQHDGESVSGQPTSACRGRADRCGRPHVEWGRYEPAIRRWEAVLGRQAPDPTDDRGRLSPMFVEWMQGYPAGWVTAADRYAPDVDPRPLMSRTAALKALGNAVVTQQAAAALRELAPLERVVV